MTISSPGSPHFNTPTTAMSPRRAGNGPLNRGDPKTALESYEERWQPKFANLSSPEVQGCYSSRLCEFLKLEINAVEIHLNPGHLFQSVAQPIIIPGSNDDAFCRFSVGFMLFQPTMYRVNWPTVSSLV